jgi:hypothetical protein
VWHTVDFPPRHDLSLLAGLLPEGASVAELSVGGLTVYAVEQRYVAGLSNPMDLVDRPTWNEAEEAVALATDALSRVAADLVSAGWAASD